MGKRNSYDAFGFNQSELRQMSGAFGGNAPRKGEHLPDLKINLFDFRPAKVRYAEKSKAIRQKIENIEYSNKLRQLKREEARLEREHPTTVIGGAKYTLRSSWRGANKVAKTINKWRR
jgi:hypothetical protein